MTGNIFISYRRADSRHVAGRLVDNLQAQFGKDRIFLDVDGIPPGRDFVEVLTERVEACSVMLVMIGSDWIDIADDAGNRRLENPNDFVRIEIRTALERNIPVIPILIDDAKMPPPEKLPEDLAALSRRQSLDIEHHSFARDAKHIAEVLEEFVPPPQPPEGMVFNTDKGRYVPLNDDTEGKDPTDTGTEPEDDFDALGWFAVVSPVFFTVLLMLLMVGGGMHAKDFAMLGLTGVQVFFGAPLIASVLVWLARLMKSPPPGAKLIWGVGCFLLVLLFAGTVIGP